MRDGGRPASLYGVLRRTSQPYPAVEPENYERPLPNVTVELTSEGHSFTARTDEQGRYAFYDVPTGVYRFSAELPPHLELAPIISRGSLPTLELPDRACYEYDLSALPTGRIRGRVLGPDGMPLASASAELFLADRYDESKPVWYGWWQGQRDKGYYEFDRVAPGKYILVFNRRNRLDPGAPYPRTFYRSAPDFKSATVIDLQEGQQVLDADIRVTGGRATRELFIRVNWPGGDLPDDVYIRALGTEGAPARATRMAPGVFRVTLIRNVLYTIFAYQDCGLRWEGNLGKPIGSVETERVQVDPSDDGIKEITLSYKGAGCPTDAKPYRRDTP